MRQDYTATEANSPRPPLFVSLTTIRSRLPQLAEVLRSLRGQSLRPDRVVLVLSEEPFGLDDGVRLSHLPREIIVFVEEGWLEILFSANTGPYRKLIPLLRRYRGLERLIVTVDDDTIYREHWLAGLVSVYETQRCVVAYRCRAMPVEDGHFRPYREWRLLPSHGDSFGEVNPLYTNLFTLPTGVGGVLYNSAFFDDLDFLDQLRKLAPFQDDLAFKAAMLCRRVPTFRVADDSNIGAKSAFHRPREPATSRSLNSINGRGPNDKAWRQIVALLEAKGYFRVSDFTVKRAQ